MRIRTSTGFVLLVLTVGVGGCESGTPASPSLLPAPSTSAVQQPALAPTVSRAFPPGVFKDYTLSGRVFEITPTGETPIEGAQVYCELCLEATHSWALTDSTGFYSFTGVWTQPDVRTQLWFGKEGYTDPPGVPLVFNQSGWRQVLVTGDTAFDVQLVRK
jgi:hypothetical protein